MTIIMGRATLIFIILASLNSCGVKEIQKPSPFINDIKSGEAFCIILPEDHSKAEMWQLTDSYNKKVVENISAVWHGNEKGIYFHLKGLSSGKTDLMFYKRKFSDTIEKKTFTVKVSQE
jgi:hypothetical protein